MKKCMYVTCSQNAHYYTNIFHSFSRGKWNLCSWGKWVKSEKSNVSHRKSISRHTEWKARNFCISLAKSESQAWTTTWKVFPTFTCRRCGGNKKDRSQSEKWNPVPQSPKQSIVWLALSATCWLLANKNKNQQHFISKFDSNKLSTVTVAYLWA